MKCRLSRSLALYASVILAVCVGSCTKPPTTPIVSTLSAEDEIATEVAKQRAVAETLTAMAPSPTHQDASPPTPMLEPALKSPPPPTTTSASASPTAAYPTPSSTATALPVYPTVVPELLAPEHGDTYSQTITFQWRGSLGAGQSYQVRAYHPKSDSVIQSDLLVSPEWMTHLPAEKYGAWDWDVSVIRNGAIVVTSDRRMFWFDPFPNKPEPTAPEPTTDIYP